LWCAEYITDSNVVANLFDEAQRKRGPFFEFARKRVEFEIFAFLEFVDFVYGTFPKEKRTLAIGFSSSMQSLDEASAALRKAPFTTRCLLTNFALSPSHTKYFRNREIAVFHYSVLDTYLDRRMTLPLIQRGH